MRSMVEGGQREARITIEGLTKRFQAVLALDNVDLSIRAGEVHGVIGENGAGKSTLMKLLSGVHRPDSGVMRASGVVLDLRHPIDAQRAGIAMIHQELNLVEDLTVADNLFLGREKSSRGFVDRAAQESEARDLLSRLDADVDPRALVRSLSIARKQLVEIAKALGADAAVLIMDEPTAVLTERETRVLLELVKRLRERGTSVLYVSHRLPEVIEICDRITVLRDGRVVQTLHRGGATEASLASLMVGRPLNDFYPPRVEREGKDVLEVSGVCVESTSTPVSMTVRAGEIVGIAGLIGAGRTELAEAISGLRGRTGGTVRVEGRELPSRDQRAAIDAGVVYVSEDRKHCGLVLTMNVRENTTLVSLGRDTRLIVNGAQERRVAEEYVARLHVRTSGVEAGIETLSGGNQQKIAIAKWLEMAPKVLILDEPTRGVDVGAKREIYEIIVQLAANGLACLVISSDLPELLGLCHRILVMRANAVVDTMSWREASEERIMHRAAGVEAAA